jgi:hypothetical protein
MTQITSNNTINALMSKFNFYAKKAQKNGHYIGKVVVDGYRLVFDLGWWEDRQTYCGNVRLEEKNGGRYMEIGHWTAINGNFEGFLIKNFLSYNEMEEFDTIKENLRNEYGKENVEVNYNEITIKGDDKDVVVTYYGENGNYCGDKMEMVICHKDAWTEVVMGFGYDGYTVEETMECVKDCFNDEEEVEEDLNF